MKKRWITSALLAISSFCNADLWNNYIRESHADLALGYRQDELNWNIASNSGHPNVLSELEWNNLGIVQIQAIGKSTLCNNFVVKGMADFGWIVSGKSRDSDYNGDHRTYEYSRSIHDSGKGFVFDASLAIGYQFNYLGDQLRLEPLLGYSVNSQHLRVYNGHLVKSDSRLGKLHGLNSSYNTYWFGPWVGFDLTYTYDQWEFFAGFEYHFALYRANGRWNLRKDMPNGFDHKADSSFGQVYTLGTRYSFCNDWTAGLIANYQDFETDKGHDTGVVRGENSYGEFMRWHFSQPLNKVTWRSFSIMATAGYQF